ncbi:hypothetical protein [Oceaniglobus roseus]|uniref:hypothetical protein n=1 Tax=Oceaniglobus roseus TaxID=1737570 RepID=UPI000C7ECBD7|nr:hypothetical protein [Kandeliimicrobium roseum]
MRWLALALGALCLALSAVLGGTAPLGRAALALNLPGLAVPLLEDPAWRGVALFDAGRFAESAEAFRAAGPEAAYDLGTAEVLAANYAAALEAYDLAMALGPDVEARANFDLVAAFYGARAIDAASVSYFKEKTDGPVEAAEVGRGSGRASGSGDEVTNKGATIALPSLQSGEQLGVRRVFDDSFIAANPRWLATLEDVPGVFLRARILEEYRRRRDSGTGQAQEEEPW